MRRRTCLVGGAWLAIEGASLGLGCDGATTGDVVSLGTRVRSDVAPGEPFTTDLGATIRITRATISVASIAYLEGTPLARRLRGHLVPAAYAHPGHYDAGLVVGEMTEPTLIELDDEPVDLGAYQGVTGLAQSAAVTFFGTPRLGGAVAIVEADIDHEGRSFSIEASVSEADVLATATEVPEIIGCPVSQGLVEGDGTFALEVGLRLWLDQVDFADPSVAEASDRTVLEPGTVPHRGLVRGIRKAAGYMFSFAPS